MNHNMFYPKAIIKNLKHVNSDFWVFMCFRVNNCCRLHLRCQAVSESLIYRDSERNEREVGYSLPFPPIQMWVYWQRHPRATFTYRPLLKSRQAWKRSSWRKTLSFRFIVYTFYIIYDNIYTVYIINNVEYVHHSTVCRIRSVVL